MQKLMLAMVTLGLLVVSQGCAPSTQQVEPDFPKDQAPAVMSTMQLDKVIGEVGSLKGNLIKLAGRIRHVRETDQGAIVLADWLSYPSHFSIEEGPPHTGPKTGRHFGFLFPGKKSDPFLKGPSFDSLMTWKGNKFVLEGKVEGTRTMAVDEFGDKQSLLFVETVCIHVWETGESDTITSTTGDDRYWLGTTARTFCAPK
jgi:hypothetical protein